MNQNPLISIITVCYNSEKYIDDAFSSILNQTYSNFEYILIDGSSTDGTLSKARAFKNLLHQDFTIVSEKDDGIYDAMNKGIELAKGELICILNSDDFFVPESLQRYVECYRGHNCADNLIIVGDAHRVDRNGEISYLRRNTLSILEQQIEFTMPLVHPAFCVHTNVYKKLVGLFNVSVKLIADYDFTYKAYKSGEVEFAFVNSVTVNMREGGVSDVFDLGLIWDRTAARFTVRKHYQNAAKNFLLCARFYTEEVLRQFLKKYFRKTKLLKTNRKHDS
ncbi:glycosyltransferase family 2 protein [Cyclobacterium xiamenense]|uniref:glycosyltransferase family 2 protein n=1 Tax=Cyclobacterium xiamenense TaxID=1297121 RepID=UPI0012B7B65C|nr:glycosyltransferase family 2 protein [Cyclobacterium xiamenense]